MLRSLIPVIGDRLEVHGRLLERDQALPESILEVSIQGVPHGSCAFASLDAFFVHHVSEIGRSVCIGEAAGQAVEALSVGVVEVAAFADVSGLDGHVLCDVVEDFAFVSI